MLRPDNSILEAMGTGAANGLLIVLSVVSNIIALLALFHFINAVVEWLFQLAGKDNVNFLWLLTKIFIPLVFIMGVPIVDCAKVAFVVAEKTVINEFIAFKSLGEMIRNNEITVRTQTEQSMNLRCLQYNCYLQGRSQAIATFAICGFANPGSLGVIIAGLSAMAPARRGDITKVAIRAFIAGSFVSFTSASIAGMQMMLDVILDSVLINLFPGILIRKEDLNKFSNKMTDFEDFLTQESSEMFYILKQPSPFEEF